jgi:tRNA-specific adenosine deaminase 2
MNRTGRLLRQEQWTPIVVASAALGLALYHLYTRGRKPAPPSALDRSQVGEEQTCQASDDDHKLDAMNAEERAYHERFMREAIAMVHHHFHSHFKHQC